MKRWEKVRHIPESLQGFDPSDLLRGTETYGNSKSNDAAWAKTFEVNKVNKVIVRSYEEVECYSKEYTKAEVLGKEGIMKKDEILNDKDEVKEKGGVGVYVEYDNFPYEIVGVHNGCSTIDEDSWYCGTIITDHVYEYFVKPAMHFYEIQYTEEIVPNSARRVKEDKRRPSYC